MGSSPKISLQSHSLVCLKNYLFIVGIGPVHDKISYVFFYMFLFFLRLIEDRSKNYRINIRYKCVFKVCYNIIYLRSLLCFGADTEIIFVLLVYILFFYRNT